MKYTRSYNMLRDIKNTEPYASERKKLARYYRAKRRENPTLTRMLFVLRMDARKEVVNRVVDMVLYGKRTGVNTLWDGDPEVVA